MPTTVKDKSSLRSVPQQHKLSPGTYQAAKRRQVKWRPTRARVPHQRVGTGRARIIKTGLSTKDQGGAYDHQGHPREERRKIVTPREGASTTPTSRDRQLTGRERAKPGHINPRTSRDRHHLRTPSRRSTTPLPPILPRDVETRNVKHREPRGGLNITSKARGPSPL